MAGNEKVVKFVRSLHPFTGSGGGSGPSFTGDQGSLIWMKVLYEFWGFCVNGDNNLRTPGVGSFATISGALAPNYLRMVPGFESGSTVLVASGSDGSTAYGSNIFNSPSANFSFMSGSTIGTGGRRFLVAWKSGSTSTDDGIYPILQVLNSQSLVVDTNTGGTPMSASNNQPRFTDRGSINYRVIDFWGLVALTPFTANDYIIFQFNAGAINAGQAPSQARMRMISGSNGYGSAAIELSPSGSWNGTSFSDLTPELVPDSGNLNGSGTGGSPKWFDGFTSLYFSVFADQGAIVSHGMGGDQSAFFMDPANFHIEIPNRIFPQSKDPNPICCLNCTADNGHASMGTRNFGNLGYFGAGWMVANPVDNGAIRRHHTMVRNLSGINLGSSGLYLNFGANAMGWTNTSRFADAFYNFSTRKHVVQDVVLGHRVTGSSYTMGRVQLRRVAFVTGPWQTMTKLGSAGEWLAITEGIVWPWDNANLPRALFPTNGGNGV